MQSLKRFSSAKPQIQNLINTTISKTLFSLNPKIINFSSKSTKPTKNGEEEWNNAWESAWLPETLSPKTRAPWELDVNFPSSETSNVLLTSDVDTETKAFVEDMNENWNERKGRSMKSKILKEEEEMKKKKNEESSGSSLYSVENMKKDYRLKKQRIHAGLWMKEIEKLEEEKLGGGVAGGDDIERLLDSCSEIFETTNSEMSDSRVPTTSEFKTKPDGWETTSKSQEGNVWEISQREEDILLQEFERRIAYSKFQIASFIKSHIFSRRRPVDGWKYMIEILGPNAKRGKGSVTRLPTLSDASTQPFKEEKPQTNRSLTSFKGRS
ncbi:mucin-like protein [Thalictrum thalictroides]|uniref:Mucin-like protein n=1 Tax=Thalictrum thalictroides TaxID=46969 RepID=A0A7J6WBH5_THATH|nr:mucin-like protein [Thalictrum thalictroides]